MNGTAMPRVLADKELTMNLNDYWRVMQSHVCVRCADGDRDGNCHLEEARECPLKAHLSFVITAVNILSSVRLQDYMVQLHGTICTECQFQAENGTCPKRGTGDCMLDTFFPVFIDSIEQVARRTVD